MHQKNLWFIYFKSSVKAIAGKFSFSTMADCIRFYEDWKKHLQPGRNPVADKNPWITFPAIEAIRKLLQPQFLVFEYGSGGSTLFWSNYVKKVVSVEHEEEWYRRMEKEIVVQQVKNIDYHYIPAGIDPQFEQKKPSNPGDYISDDARFAGYNFESYVKLIDQYPDEYFDLVMVDGRARPSCILHSLKKIKLNGYLVLDNSDRDYYLSGIELKQPGWQPMHFPGPVPYMAQFSQTTLFKKLQP